MSHAPSTRTRVKRMHLRGHYDEATVHAILDVMPICSVGYVFDGAPFVTSTLQWREGNHIYWHGSSASRMLEACEDAEVCVNVSIIDAFVMARSAFNHSCNYRSVMAFGRAYKVTDPKEKLARLKTFTNQLFPGRWDHLRPVTDKELKSTTVLGLALDEASAKIRTGMPGDDPGDETLPVWGGLLPIRMQTLAPMPDAHVPDGMAVPPQLQAFKIG
jgi:nitroimidazol reductase NimA-like FMN-containing flavoprotein (pyridoxamine 5'-phosphate oxidase superfamily)